MFRFFEYLLAQKDAKQMTPAIFVDTRADDTIESLAMRMVDSTKRDNNSKTAWFEAIMLQINPGDKVEDVIAQYQIGSKPPRPKRILAVSADINKLVELAALLPNCHIIHGTREHALEIQLIEVRPHQVVWDGTCQAFRNDKLTSVDVDLAGLAVKYGLHVKSLDRLLLRTRIRAFFRKIFFRTNLMFV